MHTIWFHLHKTEGKTDVRQSEGEPMGDGKKAQEGEGTFWGMEMVCILIVVVAHVYTVVKTIQLYI